MMSVASITHWPSPCAMASSPFAAHRLRTLAAAAAAVGYLLGPTSTQAGPAYPERPVQLIAQQPPGSSQRLSVGFGPNALPES